MIKGDAAALVRPLVKAGDVCLDVGAGRGEETTVLAELVGPTGHVYALDPDARNQEPLGRIHAASPWVTVLRVALGATEGTVPVYASEDQNQTSRYAGLVSRHPVVHVTPQLCLDDVTELPVALVKIDAQGSEVEVLTGAPRLLETCPAWVVECWPHGLHVAGSSAQALLDMLRAAGLIVRSAQQELVTDEVFSKWLKGARRNSFVNLVATRD